MAETNFSSDARPRKNGGDDMKITPDGWDKQTGHKKYLIDCSYRKPDGTASHLKATAVGSTELAIKIAAIKERIGSGSLTAQTFLKCSEHYKKHKGYRTKKDVFKSNADSLGQYKVDKRFPFIYSDHIYNKSQTLAVNTVNNYRICIRSVLNFCYKTGFIDFQPIRDFGLEKGTERDRVWRMDERTRFYKKMEDLKSHLYWSVYFAERNPIRGRSDLWHLTWDNFDELKKLIQFLPQKTAKKKSRPTFLINIDEKLLGYFDWLKKKFPDCPYLFPRIWYSWVQKKYVWAPMGDPDKHWRYICNKANVRDFHFQDLRHVAITLMLDMGYTEQDLMNLGIHYSVSMIHRYYHKDAEKVINKREPGKIKCNSFNIIVIRLATGAFS